MFALGARRDDDGRILGGVAGRVVEQVGEHLDHEHVVHLDERQVIGSSRRTRPSPTVEPSDSSASSASSSTEMGSRAR